MSLAAEPACGFDAVNVTVTKIRFHKLATAVATDAGWTEIALQPARRINIAKMDNGALTALGTAILAPGHFAQTRLVLDANSNGDTTNSVVIAGTTTEVPLRTQAVAQDGIAVGPGFDIANGQSLDLIADFDACRSVVPTSNNQYLLRPAIQALPTVKNGINGFVDTSLLGSHVRVTAQQNGVIVRATAPDPVSGQFMLTRLDPGTYDVVVTADGRASSVISAVPVTSAVSTTALNSSAAPIVMVASATGYISALLELHPSSTVQPAYGSARQTLASGTSVVIGYRMGNLATGFVTFTILPLVAPQWAPYNASGPLAFMSQLEVAPALPSYLVSASAPGYVDERALAIPAIAD